MDVSADPGTLPTHTSACGQEPPPPGGYQTESGGAILLQLLEFKTRLLEVVEELHIRRDAETRFEDQISALALEKQELEWEKESLQRRAETTSKRHAESLADVKKQFQAKIRNIEEEKGKYQVSAELKDKEINNLKEELKALQLLKYNLEKKSSELEQKLALQSRSRDSHLKQLGEVEKRFGALSRQCATVKQAHEKLEQNVDEAVSRNTKLTSANEKQDAALVSLKKELEEVSNKLIKAKMSSVRRDATPAGGEQRVQQLQHKLNVEAEMNKKLREENVSVRAEKQEVMRSLQHTQQLLLSQTQTVSRVELELQTQREQYEALKQEHEAMREKSAAAEDKAARLMESYAASETSWDKEKAAFVCEQQDRRAVSGDHDELHQKHAEVGLETSGGRQSLSVSAQLVPTSLEEIRQDETRNEPGASSSDGGLRRSASAQATKPDRLETIGSTGGRGASDHRQHPLKPSDVFPSTSTDIDRHRPSSSPGQKDEMKQEESDGQEEEEEVSVHGEDAKEGGSAQTTNRADRREDSQRSTEDAGDPEEPGTETKDRAEGPHTPETKIPAQTTADMTTEKSGARPVVDFMDADSPLTAYKPSDCSQSLSEKVCSHENQVKTFSADEHQELETEITPTQPSDPSESPPQASPQSPKISDACVDIMVDPLHLEAEVETGSCQEHEMKKDKVEDGGDAKMIKTDAKMIKTVYLSNKNNAPTETGSPKCHEMHHEDIDESPLPSNKTFRSSFDWANAQRKPVPLMSVGLLGHPSSSMPSFLRRKHSEVPSVISRASDLLNASWRRRQQGEQTVTVAAAAAAADVESRTSPSVSSFPVSMSSSVPVSRPAWQTSMGRSRAQSSESDWEPSFSQEREEEQSSFRAQISKIEQFLNTEKLRLPKRPRTDD